MKVELEVLLKVSMVEQSLKEVDRLLREEGKVIEGFHGTPEQLRQALDSGQLREVMLREVIGEEKLAEIRKTLDECNLPGKELPDE